MEKQLNIENQAEPGNSVFVHFLFFEERRERFVFS